MKKATGSVNVLSYSGGKTLTKKKLPYDTYAILIDGSATIQIDGDSFILQTGQGLIIPANTQSHIKPNGSFKLIWTLNNPEAEE